jgi:hypothetical protein
MLISELHQLQQEIFEIHKNECPLLTLDSEELFRFEAAFQRILSFYWITPETIELKLPSFTRCPNLDKKLKPMETQLFQLDQKIEAVFKYIKESLNNNLGRGYRTIASIHAASRGKYLWATMIAKAQFDTSFTGIDYVIGRFSMRPLQGKWYPQDVVCLSGFTSVSCPQTVKYRIGPQNYDHEIVWIKENDIYVASLPAVRIIVQNEYCDFPTALTPLGIRYTTEWKMPV